MSESEGAALERKRPLPSRESLGGISSKVKYLVSLKILSGPCPVRRIGGGSGLSQCILDVLNVLSGFE